MYDTNEVTITLRLPPDIAEQAIEVQRTDPEFLSRVVLYGLTRRSIYREMRDRNKGPAMNRISPKEGERILAENRRHDGGAWAEKRTWAEGEEEAARKSREGGR